MKKRKILLLEPNYKNKYPPIGLMKIATYHRNLGDDIVFFKGDLNDLFLEQLFEQCTTKLKFLGKHIDWLSVKSEIIQYLKTKKRNYLDELPIEGSKNELLILNCLTDYADIFRNKKYTDTSYGFFDRVYVTTLFTFYWKITIKTIEFAKKLVKDESELKVGGVLASLMPKEVKETTGITVMEGLLDKPGILDSGNSMIIDDLPLDYSILYEIDYEYPTSSAYFTFMTKGCTRKCSFCSVPKLEPTYKPKIETYDKFQEIKANFGEQKNLLLMDNNVLASPKFPEIIDEIKQMGFVKGATFVEPNQLDIVVRNLKSSFNDKGFVRRAHKILNEFLDDRLKGRQQQQEFYDLLDKYELLPPQTPKKENILEVYPKIKDTYEKYRKKGRAKRYVDFNQGTDCRYVTDELMKKMSEIPIRPLRIAFDYLGLKKKYVAAVELAAKYGILELSNYLLYNFKDSPDQLYERMRINIELNERLGTKIYSFPMKYIPLFGENAKNRKFVGNKWNKKFIRAIQAVLNVTKGIVTAERSFFEKAFGKNLQEFFNILYMPETYIIYRSVAEEMGLTHKWAVDFNSLSEEQMMYAKNIIEYGDFNNVEEKTSDVDILRLLEHYTFKSRELPTMDFDRDEIQRKYEKLVKDDVFINLTLTYDFEDTDNENAVEEEEFEEVN